jgi:hypothetical protein
MFGASEVRWKPFLMKQTFIRTEAGFVHWPEAIG